MIYCIGKSILKHVTNFMPLSKECALVYFLVCFLIYSVILDILIIGIEKFTPDILAAIIKYF